MWYTFHWLGQIHVTRLLNSHREGPSHHRVRLPPTNIHTLQSFLGMVGLLFPLHPRVHFTGCPSLWTPKEKEKRQMGVGKRTGGGFLECTESTHLCSHAGTPLLCLLRCFWWVNPSLLSWVFRSPPPQVLRFFSNQSLRKKKRRTLKTQVGSIKLM